MYVIFTNFRGIFMGVVQRKASCAFFKADSLIEKRIAYVVFRAQRAVRKEWIWQVIRKLT